MRKQREEGAKTVVKTTGEPAIRRGRGEIGAIRSYSKSKANVSLK